MFGIIRPCRHRLGGELGAAWQAHLLRGASVTALIMTGRLELRPFRPEDTAELHEIFSDPETHTIGEGPFTSLAQTAAWISRRAETERQHGLLWYAVRDRAGGRMLGNCGLFAGRTGSAEPEIGYEIRRSRQGQGLATEAARAVLDDALASGISCVWATIRPHNTASLRVAAKIGMTQRHTRRDSRGPLVYLSRP
ncbi:MAG: GNAT family N-acetyltransferase [Trebonia sp.]